MPSGVTSTVDGVWLKVMATWVIAMLTSLRLSLMPVGFITRLTSPSGAVRLSLSSASRSLMLMAPSMVLSMMVVRKAGSAGTSPSPQKQPDQMG